MATPIHGRSGRLYVGIASGGTAEPFANLKSWSIDFSTDKVDSTVFGDTNKKWTSGLPNVTGDFDGFYDTASAQAYTAAIDGVARAFYLYPTIATTTQYWWGTALFDFSVKGAVDGNVEVSGSFDAASAVAKVG